MKLPDEIRALTRAGRIIPPRPFALPDLTIPDDPVLRLDRVLELWAMRPCWLCGEPGRCAHREIEADLAWIDAEIARARRTERKLKVVRK